MKEYQCKHLSNQIHILKSYLSQIETLCGQNLQNGFVQIPEGVEPVIDPDKWITMSDVEIINR